MQESLNKAVALNRMIRCFQEKHTCCKTWDRLFLLLSRFCFCFGKYRDIDSGVDKASVKSCQRRDRVQRYAAYKGFCSFKTPLKIIVDIYNYLYYTIDRENCTGIIRSKGYEEKESCGR